MPYLAPLNCLSPAVGEFLSRLALSLNLAFKSPFCDDDVDLRNWRMIVILTASDRIQHLTVSRECATWRFSKRSTRFCMTTLTLTQ